MPPPGYEPFLQTVLENPADDGARLVYADWLEEQGDPRGEFIRVQIELAKLKPGDPNVERLTDREMIHLVNIPSNPPGWSAGKWGEWYPDVLSKDGKLTADRPKPYWQSGWLRQHDPTG